MISLQALNSMPAEEFVATLSGIFESSAWVAERVVGLRPFPSQLHLHEAMCVAVENSSAGAQLALIRAHPELAGRAAIRGELTPESTREQQGAGLSACSPEEFARLQTLNAAYAAKFGFPFVLAVKGHDRASILASLDTRIPHTVERERAVALQQIGRIAGFRLAALIEEPLGARIVSMAEFLARFSDQEAALTCAYLTPAHRATAALIRDWMLSAGLEVEIDAVGNVIGRWRADGSNAPAGAAAANAPATREAGRSLLAGSHYDTVVNAGRYDGRLGILLPIAVVAKLRREGVTLPYTLTIIAFAEEEGVRFKSTFLGSSAVAGTFDPSVLNNVDASGVTLREALIAAGLDPNRIADAAFAPQTLLGYVEVHIEQGPVLLNENLPLGVVTSIAGSTRSLVGVTGLAGHSGTVPMNLRHDAAAAAAELILAIEQRCSGTPGLVGTVGQLNVPGGAMNVIPGRCELSVDIRADRDEARLAAVTDVIAESERIATRRGVQIQWRKVLEVAAVPCAPRLQRAWARSIQRATGVSTPRHLPSGAGHDAMVIAGVTEVGMLFVRCGNGGISHHPAESLDEADADLAAAAFSDLLTHFIPNP